MKPQPMASRGTSPSHCAPVRLANDSSDVIKTLKKTFQFRLIRAICKINAARFQSLICNNLDCGSRDIIVSTSPQLLEPRSQKNIVRSEDFLMF